MPKLKFMLLLLPALLWMAPIRADDCLAIHDNNIREESTESGITIAEWSARVENVCDDSYDGTLTVQFLDDQGEVMHETLEIVIIEGRGSTDTRKRVNIPSDRYNRIARIKIDIRERKRPT